jgi:hypothetical protein
MAPAATDYNQFVGKKVTLTRNLAEAAPDGSTAEELEGTVEAFAGSTLLFKPKGKTTADMIEVGTLEKIDYAPDKAKKISRKKLKPVTYGQARNHLAERHGFTLKQVNGLTEKQAFEAHNGIDHEGQDLAHIHVDKDAEAASASTDDADDED